MKVKEYYYLAKPGLVYGNLIPVIAGFLTGEAVLLENIGQAGAVQAGGINFALLLATIVGIALVMGSGCVFNNVIDHDIDAEMERTKGRAIVSGAISKTAATVYGICLALVGFGMLMYFTNAIAVAAACVGFFFYVIAYTSWAKRRTIWSTVVGSVAGAVPTVVGYCAASGRFDFGAVLLFAIMVFWQVPHFYSIAIYRRDDYAAAGIPVLPVRMGVGITKADILLYVLAFTIVAPLLTVFHYAGRAYFIVAVLLGLAWLTVSIYGFWAKDDKKWARRMFFLSLAVMSALFIALTADRVLRISSLVR